MAILTKTILVLEDGKISAFDFQNRETYIQPEIIVNTLDAINQMTIQGQFKESVTVDISIQSIDGIAFGGTFAQLETALRLAALKANGLAVGGVGGGGGGDASASNQLLEIAELQSIVTNTGTNSTETKQDNQITELQSIVTNTGTNSTASNQVLEIAELQSIVTNTLTSATQAKQDTQITEIQKLTSANSPTQQRITVFPVVFSSWKSLAFIASGAVVATIDGQAITFPEVFSFGTVAGTTYFADSVSTNSVTFSGSGILLVTIQQ